MYRFARGKLGSILKANLSLSSDPAHLAGHGLREGIVHERGPPGHFYFLALDFLAVMMMPTSSTKPRSAFGAGKRTEGLWTSWPISSAMAMPSK